MNNFLSIFPNKYAAKFNVHVQERCSDHVTLIVLRQLVDLCELDLYDSFQDDTKNISFMQQQAVEGIAVLWLNDFCSRNNL